MVPVTDLRRLWPASDLAAEGRNATRQISAAMVDLVDRNRRRGGDVREKLIGELQRVVGAFGLATKEDLAIERRLVCDRISTATEDLATLARSHNDELRESFHGAVKQELSTLGQIIHAVQELAAESRNHNDELRATFQGTAKQQLGALGLITQAVEGLAAQSRALNRPPAATSE